MIYDDIMTKQVSSAQRANFVSRHLTTVRSFWCLIHRWLNSVLYQTKNLRFIADIDLWHCYALQCTQCSAVYAVQCMQCSVCSAVYAVHCMQCSVCSAVQCLWQIPELINWVRDGNKCPNSTRPPEKVWWRYKAYSFIRCINYM